MLGSPSFETATKNHAISLLFRAGRAFDEYVFGNIMHLLYHT